ncbi:MAG TPA: SDR family oxidoreductase [Kofleriaceae bacterium]|nr:SDR family oxidoreductase [Kofleriaceae bacterium]
MTIHQSGIAVVAGATRGAGRGIARALGEAGYRVVCTGRSTRDRRSGYDMPETIDETAAMIPGALAIAVDHAREAEVVALFDRVERELGPIDVVVDSVAGEDPSFGRWTGMVDSDLANAPRALEQGLVTHLHTAMHACRRMRARGRGLLVEVTEYDLLLGAGGNLVTAIVKLAIKALAATLAEELRGAHVACVSITPGFLRSEAMLRHFGVTAERWRDAGAKDPHFLHSESPLFIGRAVAHLARDPAVMQRTGQILSSWQLAREYGFSDEDGTRPDWGEHWRTGVAPTMPELRAGIEHQAIWLEQLARTARDQLGADASRLR